MTLRSVKTIYFLLSSLLLTLLSFPALASWQLNLSPGVTPISREIYGLHMTVIWVCVAIGIVVFGVMIYSLIMHRKSRGVVAATFHEHPALEFFWAIVPFVILIGLAIPATRVLLTMKDTAEASVTVKIVGHQWKWQYQYLDQNISFFSNLATPQDQIQGKVQKGEWYLLEVDKPLVLPVDRKVRFLVTSNDVIHSWWVPALGIKRDAVPGFIYESWAKIDTPGIYRGQCAELCGVFHGFMPIVIKAVSGEEFDQWVAAQNSAAAANTSAATETKVTTATSSSNQQQSSTAAQQNQPTAAQTQNQKQAKPKEAGATKMYSRDELMKTGQAVYAKYCVACHKEDGTGMPPVFPALKASSVAVGHPISRHIGIVLWGVRGSTMQSFAEQMTDEEIAAVVTYERNAWGNKTGDAIQPADVTKERSKT